MGPQALGSPARGGYGGPMPEDRLVGDDRCWPCTIANLAVGLVVAGGPVLVAVARGGAFYWGLATGWALIVMVFTLYRLVVKGYLPGAGRAARRVGLDDRIGPGAEGRQDDRSGGSDPG